MSEQTHHVALPQLRGQPAYARPPRPVGPAPKPFDPDDLPLEAAMTEPERELARQLVARSYLGTPADGHGPPVGVADGSSIRPRTFRLRSIAGRLIGGRD